MQWMLEGNIVLQPCALSCLSIWCTMHIRESDLAPASATGQVFAIYDPSEGFQCIHDEQSEGNDCDDYEVRYCCPGKFFDNQLIYHHSKVQVGIAAIKIAN